DLLRSPDHGFNRVGGWEDVPGHHLDLPEHHRLAAFGHFSDHHISDGLQIDVPDLLALVAQLLDPLKDFLELLVRRPVTCFLQYLGHSMPPGMLAQDYPPLVAHHLRGHYAGLEGLAVLDNSVAVDPGL